MTGSAGTVEPSRPAGPTPGNPPVPDGPPDVVAAGTLCWRRSRDLADGIEVLLVHRPGYDDWSWPKGKPEHGEPLAVCALRETEEETGARVVLGRPLPPVRYLLPDGRTKEAAYWSARVVDRGAPTAPPSEVDGCVWLPVAEAAQRLTHPADAEPLAELVRCAAAGELATSVAVVVRHATARPRDSWARADADRPLVAAGRRQALGLATLLRCWRPDVLVSSPWLRCRATLDPYAAASGQRVRTKNGLTEAGHATSPAKAAKHVRALVESTATGLLCTHRPVLSTVIGTLREYCPPQVAAELPDANPWLHPGEALVAHVVHRGGHRPVVVAVERHEPA